MPFNATKPTEFFSLFFYLDCKDGERRVLLHKIQGKRNTFGATIGGIIGLKENLPSAAYRKTEHVFNTKLARELFPFNYGLCKRRGFDRFQYQTRGRDKVLLGKREYYALRMTLEQLSYIQELCGKKIVTIDSEGLINIGVWGEKNINKGAKVNIFIETYKMLQWIFGKED